MRELQLVRSTGQKCLEFEVPGGGPHTVLNALEITHSCTLDLLSHVEVNYKNLLAEIGRHWQTSRFKQPGEIGQRFVALGCKMNLEALFWTLGGSIAST